MDNSALWEKVDNVLIQYANGLISFETMRSELLLLINVTNYKSTVPI